MKPEHREILDKIETYLEQPGADQLRFWQALFGMGIIVFQDRGRADEYLIRDDFNISDKKLLERIK